MDGICREEKYKTKGIYWETNRDFCVKSYLFYNDAIIKRYWKGWKELNRLVTGSEPPTYACVGTSDGIASYRSMETYISRIQDNGTDAEIEVFEGLRHGFGLGEGTVAEGWIDRAVSFWERNM